VTDSDIFNADNKAKVEDDKLPEGTSYLETLVGEGKTYKDAELLAKGAWYKDQHIKKLEIENQGYRTELEKRANSEQFVNQIMERLGAAKPKEEDHSNQSQNNSSSEQKPDVAQVARDIFNQEQQKLREASNKNYFMQEAQKILGDDFVSKLDKMLPSLDLNRASANELAAKNPNLFLSALRKEPVKVDNSHVPPQNGVRNVGSIPTGGHKTWKDYEALRKSDPRTYNHYTTQAQMMRDATKLGEDFYK